MLLLLLLSNAFVHLLAYPYGAPESTCVSMAPSHGNAIFQASNSTISISQACYIPNVPLTLTISGGQFKGFLAMVRLANGSTNGIGNISSTDPNTKTLNCGGGQTALTHTSSSTKQNINFHWTPPSNFNESVIARLTVLTGYSTFWLKDTRMNCCVSTPTTPTTSRTTAKTDLTTPTTKPVATVSTVTTTMTTASRSHVTTSTTLTTKSSTKMSNRSTLTAYTKVITGKPSSAGVLVGSIWLSIVLSLVILAK